MKTKHYPRFFPTLFLLTLLFLGCEVEPIDIGTINEKGQSLLEEFQANFSLEHFDDPTGHIVENIKVDWTTFESKSLNGRVWYEFPLNQEKPISFSGKGEIQDQFFTLLVHKSERGIVYFINKMLAHTAGEGFAYFNTREKYYGGMAYLYNLQGKVEYLFYFEKGVLLNSIQDVGSDNAQANVLGLSLASHCHEKASAQPCEGSLCNRSGEYVSPTGPTGGCGGTGGGTNGSYVMVTTHHYTDWYNNRGGSLDYSHTQYNGSTSEWVWVSSGGNGYAEYSYNYATGNTNAEGYTTGVTYSNNPPRNAEPKTFEFTLDDSIKSDDCAKAILKKLTGGDFTKLRLNDFGELETGSHLSSTILELFKNNNYWNLTLKVAEAGTNRNAFTVCENGNCTITIDDDYLKRGTSLALARTIMHESVHAYLAYLLKEHRSSEISTLLNKYYHDYAKNRGMSEHELMTQFVDAMAYSIGVWDNFSNSMDYCKYLAWSGDMQNTNAFNGLSEELKEKIRDANYAEGSAIHSSTNNAKGKPCDD